MATRRERLVEGESRPWLALLVVARLVATGIAAMLLIAADSHPALLLLVIYGLVSTAVLALWPPVRNQPAAWAADFVLVLACVVISGDWRSPFYLLWLTTLALPATQLGLRQAAWVALGSSGSYLIVSVLGGPAPGYLRPLTSETLVIHLTLPIVLVAGLSYASDALRRLQEERTRREWLAIETERRRIAWELHDSAKQRLHAAHLLVSSLNGRVPAPLEATVQRASIELESASADMDTSLAELRSPLEGRPLHEALQERARELATDGGPAITVHGVAPRMSPLVAAHVYRIGCEALTNALRHAEATTIDVTLENAGDAFRVGVSDDGRGMPDHQRHNATGVLAMRSRAESIGASLTVTPANEDGGTRVVVELPAQSPYGGSAA